MQIFKGDETEEKFIDAGSPTLELIGFQKDLFFDGANSCFLLGELIYDEMRGPLANAIPREIFRQSFFTIYEETFVAAGTFNAYVTVFKKIFGDDVVIDFTVPAPGKLNIDIEAAGVELSELLERRIVDNAYVFDTIWDETDDPILLRTVKGFETQYELEQMLKEMVPAGIFTEISLTIGS